MCPVVVFKILLQYFFMEIATAKANTGQSYTHTIQFNSFLNVYKLHNIYICRKLQMLSRGLLKAYPSTHPWHHDIKSLVHMEQIDGSTVRQVHPGDIETIYYCLWALLIEISNIKFPPRLRFEPLLHECPSTLG